MKVEHFILAQNSSIDRETNSLSVFNLLEDINVKTNGNSISLPVQAIIVARRSPEEQGQLEPEFYLKVYNNENTEVLRQKLAIRMEPNHSRSRLRVNFHIPLASSGTYRVALDGDSESSLQAEFRFDVEIKPDENASSGSGVVQ